MQNFRNYYEILDIAYEATGEEVKKAFRHLARQYHPDLNPDNKLAEERFKVIGEAYEVLSDPEKRAKYNQFSRFWQQKGFKNAARSTPQSGNRVGKSRTADRANPRTTSAVDYSQFPDFNTFVEELLGRDAPAKDFQVPDSIRESVDHSVSNVVDDRPASVGASQRKRPASAPFTVDDDRFNSTPQKTDTVPKVSPERYSSAQEAYTKPYPPQDYPGKNYTEKTYKDYQPGRVKKAYTVTPKVVPEDIEARLEVPLEKAYTGGRERVRLADGRSLEVEMPGGMVTGQQIRLRDQGINGGDLYLRVHVPEHPFLKIRGSDIYCEVFITPAEAALGYPIEVSTLDGPVKMSIPPGVRSGQKLRLAEKGYPIGDTDRGDQIVELHIIIPKTLTALERELYEKLYELERPGLARSLNWHT